MRSPYVQLLLYVGFFTSLLLYVESTSTPTVNTKSGQIQGITRTTPSGKRVDTYYGIPFAQPPTEVNRFLPAKPVKPWNETLKATALPKSCFQYEHPILETVRWTISLSQMSEDCLYMNVWVPNPKPKTKAPVMVWIHGGAFLVGSSNMELYDGANLATQENVIVVSFNYRLNVFGYLTLNESQVDGKMGSSDQIEALKWIHSNIEYFGGDPLKITVFGDSAGGISISLLLADQKTEHLYSSAIVESGPPSIFNTLNSPIKHLKSQAITQLIRNVGCLKESKEELLKCLQQLKPEVIISKLPTEYPFLFTPETSDNFLEVNTFNQVSLLIGTTSQDGSVLVPMTNDKFSAYEEIYPSQSDKLEQIRRVFPNSKKAAQEAVDFIYTDWYRPNDSSTILQQMVDMMSDIFMKCESKDMALLYFKNGNNAYVYEFNHIRSNSQYPKWIGSEHGSESYFVFGRPLDNKGDFTDEEVELSKIVMRYFANFAKYGNPNGMSDGILEEWPQFTPDEKGYMELSTNSKVKYGLRDRECAFWSQLFPNLSKECPNGK